MKKIVVCLFILSILVLTGCNKNEEPFYLEDKYYGDDEFIELDKDMLEDLINDKESFAIFIYQPACANSENFEKVLTEYTGDKQISFYKMAFSDIKETTLGDEIKYYPSFVIFHNGKMVDFLDANSDNDTNYYKDYDGFDEWFSSYVLKKEVDKETSTKDTSIEEEKINTDVTLDDVKYDENKVNIYFFWGDGCPHCEAEFEFFESIANEYGDYYTLNTFEVWNNEENANLLEVFSKSMNEDITGVPYTVIGDQTFTGFSDEYKEKMINAIISQHKNSYDVYFDSIKNAK